MFSAPKSRFQDTTSGCNDYKNSLPVCSHSAQNIVISPHCDASPAMLDPLLQSLMVPQSGIDQINSALNGCSGGAPGGASNSKSDFTPTGQSATESAWLAGYLT